MKKNKHYTLIELLITIAVIAILASLLISVLKISKEKAVEMQCKQNLKGIGVAFYDHHSDYNYFPSALAKGDAPGMYTVWADWFIALGKYTGYPGMELGKSHSDLEDFNVFSCPKAVQLRNDGEEFSEFINVFGYGMNNFLFSSEFPDEVWGTPNDSLYDADNYRARPQRMRFPSQLQLVADGANRQLGSTKLKNLDSKKFARARHSGANVLFADGRVLGKDEEYWTDKIFSLSGKNAFYRDLEEYDGVQRIFE